MKNNVVNNHEDIYRHLRRMVEAMDYIMRNYEGYSPEELKRLTTVMISTPLTALNILITDCLSGES